MNNSVRFRAVVWAAGTIAGMGSPGAGAESPAGFEPPPVPKPQIVQFAEKLVAAGRGPEFFAPAEPVEKRSVPLVVREPSGVDRKAWGVRGGVPIPRGELLDAASIRLLDAAGREVPVQGRPIATWPAVNHDGKPFKPSVQWLQLSFVADLPAGKETAFTLEYGTAVVPSARPQSPVRVSRRGDGLDVTNGRVTLSLAKQPRFIRSIRLGEKEIVTGGGTDFSLNLDFKPETLDTIPIYPLPGPAGEVTIDGKLDDAAWGSARPIELHDFRAAGAAENPTTGRLMMDEDNLYIALECLDDDMAHLAAPERKRDDFDIQYDDHVIVYVDPAYTGPTRRTGLAESGRRECFVAIYVNAAGCVREQLIHGGMESWDAKQAAKTPGRFKDSTELDIPGMVVRTARAADRWTVEMKLPLDSVHANWVWKGKAKWHDSSFTFLDRKYANTFGLSLYRQRAARATGGGSDQRWPLSVSYMNCPPLKLARVPRPAGREADPLGKPAEVFDPLPADIQPRPAEPAEVVVNEIAVEESGPVEAVIRVAGEYRNKSAWASAFTMRFHVRAGSERILCQHVVNLGFDPYTARLGGCGLVLDVPGITAAQAALAEGGTVSAPTGAELVQYRSDSYRDFGAGRKSAGGRLLGSLAAEAGGAGLAIAARGFWEKFPAGFTVARDRVRYEMWSPRAFPFFLGHSGELQNDYGDFGWRKGRQEPARVSSTHDFLISLAGDDAAALGKAVRQRALPFAGARWNCDTKARGLMAPYDRGLFPLAEDYNDYCLWWNINETHWRGWYGWADYGNTMNSPVARVATNEPRLYEWGYLRRGGYGWANDRKCIGLGYVTAWFRSGRQAWLDYGEAVLRNAMDVCTSYPVPQDKGEPVCAPRRHAQLAWASAHGSAARQGGQPGWVLFYLLTGDPRARDVVLMRARYDADSQWSGTSGSSVHATRYAEYRHILAAWLITGDDSYRARLEAFNQVALKPALKTGQWAVAPGKYRWSNALKKGASTEFRTAWGNAMPGMGHELGQWEGPLRYYQLTGDPEMARVLVVMAAGPTPPAGGQTPSRLPAPGRVMLWSNGYSSPMLRLADLYRWTGDRQILASVSGCATEKELLTGPLSRSPVPPAEPETFIHPREYCLRMSRLPKLPPDYLYPSGLTFRPLMLYSLRQAAMAEKGAIPPLDSPVKHELP